MQAGFKIHSIDQGLQSTSILWNMNMKRRKFLGYSAALAASAYTSSLSVFAESGIHS